MLGVLMPAAVLLWFMSAAMRNERLAFRQRLADVYRDQLVVAQQRLDNTWQDYLHTLDSAASNELPSVAFARLVTSNWVDSAVLLDEAGRIRYPNSPTALTQYPKLEATEAERLEQVRQFSEAARQYKELAQQATNLHTAARAFQAEARCLLQAGQIEAVIELATSVFGQERFHQGVDPQGRLIAANVELLALELITNKPAAAFAPLVQRLAGRVADYNNPALAAPQRRFLMREIQRLSPETKFSTLPAEETAALAAEKLALDDRALRRAPISGFWQVVTPRRRVVALVRTERITEMANQLQADRVGELTLMPPEVDPTDAFLTLPAGTGMPGWQLALSTRDRNLAEMVAGRRIAFYLWSGLLAVAVTAIFALLTFRFLRRRVALARLKNDLAATVSHELKTPLSAMRVLLDSLLEADHLEPDKTREYLQLIAQENDRLARLIQHFLTFSRLEQNKFAFHFSPMSVAQVVDAVLATWRGWPYAADYRLDVQTTETTILADVDALSIALLNLLENACKYSDNNKQIALRVVVENQSVVFSVEDNGNGIAPEERTKIFEAFYQVDRRLSRPASGCGLGLSIVRFIIAAHGGSVTVSASRSGGSIFSISLPVSSSRLPSGRLQNLPPPATAAKVTLN